MKTLLLGHTLLILFIIITIVALYSRLNTVEDELKRLQEDMQLICMPDCPYYEGIEK